MNKILLNRFQELEDNSLEIKRSVHSINSEYMGNQKFIDQDLFSKWIIQVKNLFSLCAGETSIYYIDFIKEEIKDRGYETNLGIFNALIPIFQATKEDYEKGYIVSIQSLVQAEVFDSELEQAEELLNSGYHVASAVIAGTVLETTLRTLCDKESIEHGSLNKMNNELTKKGIYNKLQSKKIIALADIRNSAAHGKVDEFTKEDVISMIKDTETFLIAHLSK